jgi:hypothetical protein
MCKKIPPIVCKIPLNFICVEDNEKNRRDEGWAIQEQELQD